MTQLIYKYEGSLGSRLHKSEENVFVAYAQWPDKETFDHAGGNLPMEAEKSRLEMRNACVDTNVEYKLDMVVDMLKH
jgi:hypothetical protein